MFIYWIWEWMVDISPWPKEAAKIVIKPLVGRLKGSIAPKIWTDYSFEMDKPRHQGQSFSFAGDFRTAPFHSRRLLPKLPIFFLMEGVKTILSSEVFRQRLEHDPALWRLCPKFPNKRWRPGSCIYVRKSCYC